MKRTFHDNNREDNQVTNVIDDPFSEENIRRVMNRVSDMKKSRINVNPYHNTIKFQIIEDDYRDYIYDLITNNMNTFSFNILYNKKLDNYQINMLRNNIRKLQQILDNIYYCCSDEVRNFLMNIGGFIKRNNPSMELEDIYSALILSAYSLLGEQTEDFLKIDKTKPEVTNLYLQLTTGDLIYNGKNVSSDLRRFLLGLSKISPASSPASSPVSNPAYSTSSSPTSSSSTTPTSSSSSNVGGKIKRNYKNKIKTQRTKGYRRKRIKKTRKTRK